MKQLISPTQYGQTGSANLLITLVLTMSITLVTLAVAKTQLAEQRMSTNSHWHTRLSLEARSSWSNAIVNLVENFETINWAPAPDNQGATHLLSATTPDNSMLSTTMLLQIAPHSRFFDIQTTSTRNDGSGLFASFSQEVRLLTVLAPAAESPPPLILNGCITQASIGSDIRPLDSDTDVAGVAVWLASTQPCPAFTAIDLHQGNSRTQSLLQSLWSAVFTVSIEEFTAMAQAEQVLPAGERRFRVATPADFFDGRWTQSLGSPTRPIVLYFPEEIGCPEFSPGVRIFGIVFINASCPDPIADVRLEIFGSLVVNGDLNAGSADLQLNHIQVADNSLTLLNFPVLRSVKVPGSWRDF